VVGKEVASFYKELCRLKNEIERFTELRWITKKLKFVEKEWTTYTVESFCKVNIGYISTLAI